jgi:hypothetical protein
MLSPENVLFVLNHPDLASMQPLNRTGSGGVFPRPLLSSPDKHPSLRTPASAPLASVY